MLNVEITRWLKRPKGTTPLPAHGTMRVRNGEIFEKSILVHQIPAAKQALLARIMSYVYQDKTTGKVLVNSMSFTNVIRGGVKPRDPEKQKLVLRLASKEGPALARELASKL